MPRTLDRPFHLCESWNSCGISRDGDFNGRTCEIGLSEFGGMHYRSIFFMMLIF